MAPLLIGELARTVGVDSRTIRYYEAVGLLPEPSRADNNYRLYGDEDVERLRFILRARTLELSLEEIDEILSYREEGEAPCPYVLRLMDRKIGEIQVKIEGLRKLKDELRSLRDAAAELPPEEAASTGRICHIIENQSLISPAEVSATLPAAG